MIKITSGFKKRLKIYSVIVLGWSVILGLVNIVQENEKIEQILAKNNLENMSASAFRQWGPQYANYYIGKGSRRPTWGPQYILLEEPKWNWVHNFKVF